MKIPVAALLTVASVCALTDAGVVTGETILCKYLSKFLLNKLHKSEYGMNCSM